MTASRWRFATLDGSEIYEFPVNPNEHGSFVETREIAWEASPTGFSGRREGRTPLATSFSGVVRSEGQYNALLDWLNKKTKIRLTTDLGQQFIVRLTAYKPTQEAGYRSRHAPWRHTYTMDLLIFTTEAVL